MGSSSVQLYSEKAARSEGRDCTGSVGRSEPSPPSFLGRLSPERAKLRGGHPSCADELERGARRPCGEDGPWATVVRSIPRERPPSSPAGLGALVQANWSEKSATSGTCRRFNTGVTIWARRASPLASFHSRAEGALRLGFNWNDRQRKHPGQASGRAPRKSRSGLDPGQFFPIDQPAACTSRSLQSKGRSAIHHFVASSH